MNQLAGRFLLAGLLVLGGCSDDDGIDVNPKDQNAQAGSGGGGAAGSAGMAGSGAVGGSGGSGGNGGSGALLDAGTEDTCTPVFLDGGVPSDAGAVDAGDAGDAGAPNNNGPVTFAADIHPILRAKCSPCHETLFSGGHNVAAVDVDEAYSFVKDIKGSLVARVNGGGMPPAPNCNGAPGSPGCISLAELDLIVRWAAQCFPQ